MKKVPDFLCRNIRGALGKLYVIKHYKGGKVVKTRFPDMRGIVASQKQRERRDLFKEAVVYAKWVIADKGRKEAFRRMLPREKQKNVYQAALQLYMKGDQWAIDNGQWAKSERQWAMSNKQWAKRNKQWARGNKQLAMSNRQRGVVNGQWLMVKGVKGETSNVKGYNEQGPWKVVWQKGEDGVEEGEKGLRGFGNLLGLG